MNFSPMSPQEILESKVLPNGIYPFRVKSAVEKQNAGGKPHIDIHLTVEYKGRVFELRDILSPEKMDRLYAACVTCGLGAQYVTGSVQARDFVDRSGNVRVTMVPESPEYSARNFVSGYVASRVPKRI